MTLSDGTKCSAGREHNNRSYTFKEDENITKVEVFYEPNSPFIEQIVFYQDDEVLFSTYPEGAMLGGKE